MKKFIILFLMCFMLSGCSSLIPRITMDTPNTLPQSLEKGKVKNTCKGEVKLNEMGEIIYCSKGYYNYEESYNKQERKMTIVERIKSFINALVGSSFWIFVALIIFCPSILGFVFGKLIEATVGITGQALKSTVKAIGKAKKNGGNFMSELDREHSKNRNIQKKINALRAEE